MSFSALILASGGDVGRAIQKFAGALTKATEFAFDVAKGAFKALVVAPAKAVLKGLEAISNAICGKEATAAIKKAISGVAKAVWKGAKAVGKAVFEGVKGVAKGVWNGIKVRFFLSFFFLSGRRVLLMTQSHRGTIDCLCVSLPYLNVFFRRVSERASQTWPRRLAKESKNSSRAGRSLFSINSIKVSTISIRLISSTCAVPLSCVFVQFFAFQFLIIYFEYHLHRSYPDQEGCKHNNNDIFYHNFPTFSAR